MKVIRFQVPELTQKEAKEQGLVTEKELKDVRTSACNNLIRSKHNSHLVSTYKDRIRPLLHAYNGATDGDLTYRWYSETLCVFSRSGDLAGCRKVLKELFGTWGDAIDDVSPYDTESVEVTHRPTIELPVSVSIEVHYADDELPAGVLKEGCVIQEHTRTDRSIVCHTD